MKQTKPKLLEESRNLGRKVEQRSFTFPPGTLDQMKRFKDEVNWSAVVYNAIVLKLAEMEKQ